jgi:hypothetical protein
MSEASQSSFFSLLFPSEILLEIFAHCAPSNLDALHTTDLDTPLALSAVSRLWRRLAHDSPALWTNIVLTQKTVRSMPFWLERSCDLPITVFIRLEQPTPANDRELYKSLLERLYSQLHRCRSLNVSILDRTRFEQLLPTHLLHSFPILEVMKIHLKYGWRMPPEDRTFQRQIELPSIRVLHLRGDAAKEEVKNWRCYLLISFLCPQDPLINMPSEVSLSQSTFRALAHPVYHRLLRSMTPLLS